jgi:3-oxoacyl-[acyl-carrier-protein] synthase I
MKKKRVVVTGIGIVSSIGNHPTEVVKSLALGKSGVSFFDSFAEIGFKSQVAGAIDIDFRDHIPRKALRFMGDGAAYTYIAMQQAIADAQLKPSEYIDPRVGLVVGTGGASGENQVRAADIARQYGVKKVGAYMVPRIMASTASACIANDFKIKGVNYTLSAACATSAHCVGHAYDLIQMGKQDRVFAGGGEELHWTIAIGFDSMGALSSNYNQAPTRASRPYDQHRDGFVASGGGGILVLEDYELARARGAKIYAEMVGYGATSDGYDMVAPSGEGAVRCMQLALADLEEPVDYVNAHGTSTVVGDVVEIQALREVFSNMPLVSSTKSMTGHALGAAGVHEIIYSLLMMRDGFIAPSVNIDHLDAQVKDVPIISEYRPVTMRSFMSNSFGFGGTNASTVFKKFD